MSEINKLALRDKSIINFADSYFKNLMITFNNIDKKSIHKLEKRIFRDKEKKTPHFMYLVMVVAQLSQ